MMTNNIYHYVVPLPEGINEAIMSGIDGYTVYTSDRLDDEGRLEAYRHALRHINNNDFETEVSVNTKEIIAHMEDNHESNTNSNDYPVNRNNTDESLAGSCI